MVSQRTLSKNSQNVELLSGNVHPPCGPTKVYHSQLVPKLQRKHSLDFNHGKREMNGVCSDRFYIASYVPTVGSEKEFIEIREPLQWSCALPRLYLKHTHIEILVVRIHVIMSTDMTSKCEIRLR